MKSLAKNLNDIKTKIKIKKEKRPQIQKVYHFFLIN